MFKVSHPSRACLSSPEMHLLCKSRPFHVLETNSKLSKAFLPGVNVSDYQRGKHRAGLTCSSSTSAAIFAGNCGEYLEEHLPEKSLLDVKHPPALRAFIILIYTHILPHWKAIDSVRDVVVYLRNEAGMWKMRCVLILAIHRSPPPPTHTPSSLVVTQLDRWKRANTHGFLPSPPCDVWILISGGELDYQLPELARERKPHPWSLGWRDSWTSVEETVLERQQYWSPILWCQWRVVSDNHDDRCA